MTQLLLQTHVKLWIVWLTSGNFRTLVCMDYIKSPAVFDLQRNFPWEAKLYIFKNFTEYPTISFGNQYWDVRLSTRLTGNSSPALKILLSGVELLLFTKHKILDRSKLIVLADYKTNVNEILNFVLVENLVGKSRKCWLLTFSLFTTMLSKAFFPRVMKASDCLTKGEEAVAQLKLEENIRHVFCFWIKQHNINS